MPVYASTPRFADRRHPRALMLIIGGHAVLIGAVMTAKMEIVPAFVATPTEVELLPAEKDPPPEAPPPDDPQTRPQQQESRLDRPTREVPVPIPRGPTGNEPVLPLPPSNGPIGPSLEPTPPTLPPTPTVVRTGPRFATPNSLIEPPYPTDKLRTEEEAVLRLKLFIDERGRVTAVEPVGRVDRSFLNAARRHLIAHWRYRPATEDGRPVASSTEISLTFRLE